MSLILSEADSVNETLSSGDVAMLARTHGHAVFNAAFRVLGNTAQAEDIQQDVFLRLIETRFPEVASWPAFLTTLTTRMAIDSLRRKQRWRRLLPLWQATASPYTSNAEHAAQDSQRAEHLRRELSRLKPREAECFTLRCIHGMEISDIASSTGMSVNHVSVSLHRAVRSLETRLGDAEQTTPETHS